MAYDILRTALLAATIGIAGTGFAWADCESDLIQLEEAFKAPNLTPDATAALETAKTQAVAALKKDDDGACHKAVDQGLTKAGLKLK
jgi:hypothetical protein